MEDIQEGDYSVGSLIAAAAAAASAGGSGESCDSPLPAGHSLDEDQYDFTDGFLVDDSTPVSSIRRGGGICIRRGIVPGTPAAEEGSVPSGADSQSQPSSCSLPECIILSPDSAPRRSPVLRRRWDKRPNQRPGAS